MPSFGLMSYEISEEWKCQILGYDLWHFGYRKFCYILYHTVSVNVYEICKFPVVLTCGDISNVIYLSSSFPVEQNVTFL